MTSDIEASTLPPLVQGGMGVAVSGWRLARRVSELGGLGVVSGTALDTVHARQLADGDPGGHLRRAWAAFPIPGVADRILRRWYRPEGRGAEPYRPASMFGPTPNAHVVDLTVLATFAEVWLAKEGHDGPIGVNLLHKIQLPTVFALYGAMLAGVDVVVMGAGIPSGIPRLLDALATGGPAVGTVDLENDSRGFEVRLDPAERWGFSPGPLPRPAFLAVVSSHTLAAFLARDPQTRPDGFVVEGPTAGGHNAPPRGTLQLDESGQPRYGRRDVVDLEKVAELGLPYWLAGGYGTPGGLARARATGARGIQVGTAFALCDESGLDPAVKTELRDAVRAGEVTVRTDPLASPSGYPFKVADLAGTAGVPAVTAARTRVCDLGYLRVAYRREDGTIGMRCSAEPVEDYVRKGGDVADTVGRICLCNGLTASVGLGQVRADGEEPALVTTGDDLGAVVSMLAPEGGGWTALDVVRLLLDDEP